MAAPTLSTRGTPAGFPLEDGFVSKISFGRLTTVSFWEKSMKPPGMDGGDSIPQTTMFNTTYMTKAAQRLIDLTDSTVTAAYDPNLYSQILSLINVEGAVTQLFPDGSTLTYYGYLQKFEPAELKRGEQPECTITIVVTNRDPSNNVEAAPVVASVSGT